MQVIRDVGTVYSGTQGSGWTNAVPSALEEIQRCSRFLGTSEQPERL